MAVEAKNVTPVFVLSLALSFSGRAAGASTEDHLAESL